MLTAVFSIAVLVPLLLPAPPAHAAGPVDVTIQPCDSQRIRLRQYPVDHDATWLSARWCGLTDVDPTDLTGLPNVTIIYLHSNRISQLDAAIFRPVPKLKWLHLGFNLLREVPVFPEQSCPRLNLLVLYNNRLTRLDNSGTFSACSNLDHLDLSNNRIEYLHPEILSSLSKLYLINLSYNKIDFIPEQLFATNYNIKIVYIFNNRLKYLPVNFVANLKHDLEYIWLDFYNNPWDCMCLLELLADQMRAGGVQRHNSLPYLGKQPQCVFIGRGKCDRPLFNELGTRRLH